MEKHSFEIIFGVMTSIAHNRSDISLPIASTQVSARVEDELSWHPRAPHGEFEKEVGVAYTPDGSPAWCISF